MNPSATHAMKHPFKTITTIKTITKTPWYSPFKRIDMSHTIENKNMIRQNAIHISSNHDTPHRIQNTNRHHQETYF